MARRKLIAIPWGITGPAIDIFPDGSQVPILEIDDQTGVIYSGSTPLTSGGNSGADTVIQVSTNSSLSFVGANDLFVEAIGGAGGILLQLPSAVGAAGQVVKILKFDAGAGAVSFQGAGGQTINGSASASVISFQWQVIQVESDGANWVIIGQTGFGA